MPMNLPSASAPGLPRQAATCSRWYTLFRVDLLGFTALASISVLLGLLINQMRPQPLTLVYRSPQQQMRAAVARLKVGNTGVALATPAGQPREIVLDEFQAFVADKRGQVIDARPASFYALGHVPGAINLSRVHFAADYERLRGQLQSRKTEATAIYCSGADCPDSEEVADALRELGFTQLRIYREGWEEWSQSGLPQEK